jgi:hypothetical protein
MANITPEMLLSFQDELEKQAVDVRGLARGARALLARQGTTAGSGAALGGAAGGLLGLGAGGAKKYREARQQGATSGEALRAGLGGAARGAATGAALGAGAGGLAGLAGGGRARALAGKLRGKEGPLSSVSRFGERQVHGLTGYVPHTGAGSVVGGQGSAAVRAMRGGAHAAEKELAGATKHLKDIQAGGYEPGMVGKGLKRLGVDMEGRALKGAEKGRERALKGLQAATKSEEMGLTSLPGYAKALVGKGKYVGGAKAGQKVKALEALKAGVGEQWHASGPAGKALTFGLPAASVASEALRPSQPGEEGKGARMGKAMGSFAYGLAPISLLGVSALGSGLSAAGGAAGKGIDYAAGRRTA